MMCIILVATTGCGGSTDAPTSPQGGHTTSSPATPAPVPPCGDIVFAGVVGNYGTGYRIYCIDADGSKPRMMTSKGYEWEYPFPTYESRPVWSSDGSRMLFISEAAQALLIADATGRNLTQVTAGDFWAAEWSPDGSKIAYIRHMPSDTEEQFPKTYSEIGIISTATNQPLFVLHQEQNLDQIEWSPDSELVAYSWVDHIGLTKEIRAIDSEAVADYLLVAGFDLEMGVWTPSGESFLYALNNVAELFDPDAYQFRTVSRDGTDDQRVIETTVVRIGALTLSPDGSWLAFTGRTATRAHQQVFLMRTDGTELHHLRPTLADEFHPSWSPDGSRLLVWKQTGSAWIDLFADVIAELHSVPIDGSASIVLLQDIMGWNLYPDAAWRPGTR
jgi:Tol biopolymer transport system component